MAEAKARFSRRQLFSRTSRAAVVSAIGVSAVARATDAGANRPAVDSSRGIVNYNAKMRYRPLGKTGLMLSEVSLGGHWKNRNAESFWRDFANDEVPEDVAKNRTEVVSACIDAGINLSLIHI